MSGRRARLGLLAWWRARSRFTRHFLINVAIGLCITAVLRTAWVQDNVSVQAVRDSVITWQLNQLSGVDHGDNLAWVDIDEDAYRMWGVHNLTRRDKLAELIAFAVKGTPRVIVVDVDLALPEPEYGPYDRALQRYLQGYQKTCRRPCPSIILVRTVEQSPTYAYAGESGLAKRMRPSFLDAALGTAASDPWRNAGPVFWGSIESDREPDLVVRRFRLWEVACNGPGRGTVIPSAILLASALWSRADVHDVRAALEPHAAMCVPASGTVSEQRTETPTTSLFIGHRLTLSDDALQRRVSYRIAWSGNDNASTSQLHEHFKAGPITENASANPSLLHDQIVFIGSSFRDSADLHATPLGEMPGVLVLLNATNSLLKGREFKPENWPVALGVEFILILAISWLFAAFSPGLATLISIAIVVFGSLTIGFVAFNSGVWVDSVAPLLGVLAHEAIARTHHYVARWSNHDP